MDTTPRLHATPQEIAAYEHRLAARTSVPFGTDWNRLPLIPEDAYPFRGYTITCTWHNGQTFRWHSDAPADQGSIEAMLPSVRFLGYSAD